MGLKLAITASLLLAATPAFASDGKIGMPQLNIQDFPPQLVWLGIIFILLYLLMSRLALPKVADVLEERSSRIAADLTAAEQLKQKSEKAIADYEAALAKARLDAQTLAKQTQAQSTATAQTARAKAEAEVTLKVKAAEASIQTARLDALKNVGEIAKATTSALLSKLALLDVSEQTISAAIDAANRKGR